MNELKRCCICREMKPRLDFYRNASRPDGFGDVCKPCDNKRKAERDAKNPEGQRERWRNSTARNEKKRLARMMKRQAVVAGAITPWPACAVPDCCETESLHGHHVDYDQPLTVVWLCREHHNQLHVEHRNAQR